MELLYVWIEQYGCLKESEFYFSDKYEFDFDLKVNTLICTRGKNLSLDFWGSRVSNLSVVVGDNGAGKTTLLRCIMDCISYGGMNIHNKCIFAFFDRIGNKIMVYACGKFENGLNIKCYIDDLNDAELFIQAENSTGEGCTMPQLKKSKLIYMHNVLNPNDYLYKKYGQVCDCSIGGMLNFDYRNNLENYHIEEKTDKVVNYFNNEMHRQIDFLYNYKSHNIEFETTFDMPDKLTVEIVNNKHCLQSINRQLKVYSDDIKLHEKDFEKKIEKFVYMINDKMYGIKDHKESNKMRWLALVIGSLIANALKEIAVSPTVSPKRGLELECFLKAHELIDDNQDILTYGLDFFSKVETNLQNIQSLYAEWIIPYKKFIEWLNKSYEDINFDFSKLQSVYDSNPTFFVYLNDDNKKIFETFFSFYNKTCRPFYYLKFSWGLSTGESNLLSLYARLFSTLKTKVDGSRGEDVINNFSNGPVKCNSIILLIDEADLSYHPQWQRSFINSLIKFLSCIFKNCEIQVILTTHSPIILSDVPRSNVIYLKQGKNDSKDFHRETFGQNIYTLFDDAFFLGNQDESTNEKAKGGLIGEFAKNKIEKVNEFLDLLIKDTEFREKIKYEGLTIDIAKKIISFIGEPITKHVLECKLKKLEEIDNSYNLKEAIRTFDNLTENEKGKLIQYIVDTQSK